MTRRDHLLVTALAATGLVVTLWQCWYIYLPPAQAAEWARGLFWCRLTPQVDCFESLSKFGAEIKAGPLPVFATLAALFLWQVLLGAFAWVAEAGPREAWLAVAKLVSFPTAGFAVFVLLHDYSVAKVTSASSLLVAVVAVTACVHTVVRGIRGARLGAGRAGALGFLAIAALFGFFLHGAGAARLEIDRVEREREAAPPNIRYVDFAPQVPRAGAASLGDPTAPAELLLFVDPDDQASRQVMLQLANLAPEYAERVFVYVFAKGEHGPRLLLAHRANTLERYLRTLAEAPGDPATVRDLAARQEQARQDLGIEEFPAAVWGRHPNQRTTGVFELKDVLERAAFRHE